MVKLFFCYIWIVLYLHKLLQKIEFSFMSRKKDVTYLLCNSADILKTTSQSHANEFKNVKFL